MKPSRIHFVLKLKQPTSKHTILTYANLSSNIRPPPSTGTHIHVLPFHTEPWNYEEMSTNLNFSSEKNDNITEIIV